MINRSLRTSWLLALGLAVAVGASHAQTGQKPSYYGHLQQSNLIPPLMPEQTAAKTQQDSLAKVTSRQDFDVLARVYEQGTPFEIPHILFVIDRQDHNRIDYVNTPKHQLHERFVTHLLGKKPSKSALKSYYYEPDRRYVFGTLSWRQNIRAFTYEFWEGDKLTPELLRLTDAQLKRTFYAPVQFKTNSSWHQQVGTAVGLNYVTQEALIKEQHFMALNPGLAVGRLKLVQSEADLATVGEHDIVILKEVPLSLPPVAAVINEQPSTILSHVNLLTKGWRVPNIYLKDASKIMGSMLNQNVTLKVGANHYSLAPAAEGQLQRRTAVAHLPQPNLTDAQLRPLSQLDRKDHQYCGSKAANLGAIKQGTSGLNVPDGFCIPFAQFQQFMDQQGITAASLNQMEAQFEGDVAKRKAGLAALRQRIMAAPVEPEWVRGWAKQWQQQLQGQGVFVRSSSNSEDLPNFSGAGLYQTVPNVTTETALAEAVKTVWASVFHFEAYEARRVAGFPQDSVKMSVLVQQAINADASGVMVTLDPFDESRKGVMYLAAKRGIGIRVVEGKRIAEQVLYTHRSGSVQVLTHSADEVALQLDDQGGVVEVPLSGAPAVLDEATIKQLAAASVAIKTLFGEEEQDIEWAIKDGEVLILQARPYIRQIPLKQPLAVGLSIALLSLANLTEAGAP